MMLLSQSQTMECGNDAFRFRTAVSTWPTNTIIGVADAVDHELLDKRRGRFGEGWARASLVPSG
jgi:hypothetical protein